MGELANLVRERGLTTIPYLPVLETEGFIVRGWAHLLSAYPKSGKTEFLIRTIIGWPNETIVWFTEEPEVIWEYRINQLPEELREQLSHITLVYAFGLTANEVFGQYKDMETRAATVVIVDTISNVIRPKDENDNAIVADALRPWIALARKDEQTLILVHHDNQRGGKAGRGIRGASAFLASVDVFLQILPGKADHERVLAGKGRIREIEDKTYTLDSDGYMRWLEDDGTRATTMMRIRLALGADWQTTAEIGQAVLGASANTLARALKALADERVIERSPPINESASGKTVKWRKL